MSASPETSSASAPENGQGPGIIPYTGQSLGDVGEIMNAPEMSSDIIEQIAGFDIALFLAGGTAIDVIFRDTAEGGFSLANMRLAPDYILPTHRHNVDCLYYVLSGSIQLGRRRIDAGGGFFWCGQTAHTGIGQAQKAPRCWSFVIRQGSTWSSPRRVRQSGAKWSRPQSKKRRLARLRGIGLHAQGLTRPLNPRLLIGAFVVYCIGHSPDACICPFIRQGCRNVSSQPGCVQHSGVRVGPDQRYRRVVAE